MNLSHAIKILKCPYTVYKGHNVRVMEMNCDHTSTVNFKQMNLKEIPQQYIRKQTIYFEW